MENQDIKFNVYIVSIDNFKAVKKVGENLSLGRTYVCRRSYQKNLDLLNYFVDGYEVGSERDLELANDLK